MSCGSFSCPPSWPSCVWTLQQLLVWFARRLFSFQGKNVLCPIVVGIVGLCRPSYGVGYSVALCNFSKKKALWQFCPKQSETRWNCSPLMFSFCSVDSFLRAAVFCQIFVCFLSFGGVVMIRFLAFCFLKISHGHRFLWFHWVQSKALQDDVVSLQSRQQPWYWKI